MSKLSRSTQAISRLSMILLLLASLVLGATLSYVIVMGTFYNIPLETTQLSIIDLYFPVHNATTFNVTVLNPSYSPSDVKITEIRFTVEDNATLFRVMDTEPSLPFTLKRGRSQTFRCTSYWGGFAGKKITVHVLVDGASGPNMEYQTSPVNLTVTPIFNPRVSVEHFNLTVKSAEESVINLTISEIIVNGISVASETTEYIEPRLPYVLAPGENVSFFCDWNWRALGGQNLTVIVKTKERYEGVGTTPELQIAYLDVAEVLFNETDANHITVIVANLNESTIEATITGINITLQDGTVIQINETYPPLSVLPSVPPSMNASIVCTWNWTLHRSETINVTARTKEGFDVSLETVTTPPEVLLRIEKADFNLTNTDGFNLTVKNLETSLQNVDLDKIEVRVGEDTDTVWDGTVPLNIGDSYTFHGVEWNWMKSAGKTATITVYTAEGFNVSLSVELPCVKLEIVDVVFANFSGLDYFNITVRNDVLSLRNVTLWEITIEVNGQSIPITNVNIELSPNGTELTAGSEITVSCTSDWKWSSHIGEIITVRILTREGYETTISITVEAS